MILMHKQFDDRTVIQLARYFTFNHTIRILDLRYNRIGDAGAEALAFMLSVNTTLATLLLDNNRIGARGARALITALLANRSLKRFSITQNGNHEDVAADIAHLFTVNLTLRTFGVDIYQRQNKLMLKKALKYNYSLIEPNYDIIVESFFFHNNYTERNCNIYHSLYNAIVIYRHDRTLDAEAIITTLANVLKLIPEEHIMRIPEMHFIRESYLFLKIILHIAHGDNIVALEQLESAHFNNAELRYLAHRFVVDLLMILFNPDAQINFYRHYLLAFYMRNNLDSLEFLTGWAGMHEPRRQLYWDEVRINAPLPPKPDELEWLFNGRNVSKMREGFFSALKAQNQPIDDNTNYCRIM